MSLYPFFPHWQAVRVQSRGTAPFGRATGPPPSRGSGARAISPASPRAAARRDHGPGAAEHVISNCNLLDFQARVFAGLVVGWIHKPVALGVERSYGRGRLVASTFRLFRDEPMADPTATMLLDSLVELAVEARAPPRGGRAGRRSARPSSGTNDKKGGEIVSPPFAFARYTATRRRPSSYPWPTTDLAVAEEAIDRALERGQEKAALAVERGVQNTGLRRSARSDPDRSRRTVRPSSGEIVPGDGSGIGQMPEAGSPVDQQIEDLVHEIRHIGRRDDIVPRLDGIASG